VIRELVLALGLLAIVEGLALALVPGGVQAALAALARLAPEERRLLGLLAVALGTALVWVVRP
jgi:uncharacterized protein YjeT (DUF2065 family)